MNYVKNALKRKSVLVVIAIVVLGGGFYAYKTFTAKAAPTRYVTAAAEKGTLLVSVSGSGQVASTNQVNILPQTTGTITGVRVSAGQNVNAGQTLATLDPRNASAALAQARASLAAAQANYQTVLAGAISTDIATAQNQVASAQNSLDNANTSYDNTTAQQKQAVATALSNLLNSGVAAVPVSRFDLTATLTISGSYSGTDQGQYNVTLVTNGLGGLVYSVNGLEQTSGDLVRGFPIPLGTHGLYMTFGTTGTFSPVDRWTVSIPNTMSSTYVSNTNAYQTALQNQTQALASAQNQIKSAQLQLQNAQIALSAKQSPPTAAAIATAQAQVDQAQAGLQNAQDALNNTVITAPFTGQVAAINVQKGDTVGASTAIATLIANQEIAQVSLNEVDAAKVKVGDKATLTFDAISGLDIAGRVASVDTLGTVTSGVVNYNVKISLDTQDDRIKPGMSVSANIITDARTDVLMVPNSAVKTSGTQTYVQILDNSATGSASSNSSQGITSATPPTSQVVTVGASNDSMTEITSGLKEGDQVVTRTITGTSTASASTNTNNTTRTSTGATQIQGGTVPIGGAGF